MTRDQVLEAAKEWSDLMHGAVNWHRIPQPFWDDEQMLERQTVLQACLDLAYLRTKEALAAYSKEREEKFAAHDRMLETIEQTLKGELRNAGME